MHVDFCFSITDLPEEAILDMSQPGDAGPAVEHWRRELNFTVDPARAFRCIKGYGAWDEHELTQKSDDELAEIILWLAAGSFSEYMTECEDAGIDPRGERPEDFDPNCGSDIFCLES